MPREIRDEVGYIQYHCPIYEKYAGAIASLRKEAELCELTPRIEVMEEIFESDRLYCRRNLGDNRGSISSQYFGRMKQLFLDPHQKLPEHLRKRKEAAEEKRFSVLLQILATHLAMKQELMGVETEKEDVPLSKQYENRLLDLHQFGWDNRLPPIVIYLFNASSIELGLKDVAYAHDTHVIDTLFEKFAQAFCWHNGHIEAAVVGLQSLGNHKQALSLIHKVAAARGWEVEVLMKKIPRFEKLFRESQQVLLISCGHEEESRSGSPDGDAPQARRPSTDGLGNL